MLTFIIGLFILILGGFLYGHYAESIFKPDDRETPATTSYDGIDFVAHSKRKNFLSQLLNLSGLGPILGAIQGILFGPLALLTIPFGSVLVGAIHDYFSGMIAMRHNGAQMPRLIKKYLGGTLHTFYHLVMMVLLLLLAALFIYTPGEIVVGDILKQDTSSSNPTIWVVYGLFFLYYLVATFFPISEITAGVTPIFSGLVGLAALGLFFGVLVNSDFIHNVDFKNLSEQNLSGSPWIPIFFVTLSSGILSSFHGTQASLVSRSVSSEKEGKVTFFNTMLAEGFIAMIWAAAAMIVMNANPSQTVQAAEVIPMINSISQYFLGKGGAIILLISVVVLPLTSADSALKSLRLILAERFNIDQVPKVKRALLSVLIFLPTALVIYFTKINLDGFPVLWRSFNFFNLLVATFALTMISVYLFIHKKNGWVSLLPAMFYIFILTSFITHDSLGFSVPLLGRAGYTYSYLIASLFTISYAYFTLRHARKFNLDLKNHNLF